MKDIKRKVPFSKRLKKKGFLGGIDLPSTLISLLVIAVGGAAIYGGNSIYKDYQLENAIDEVISYKDDVANWTVKATDGDGTYTLKDSSGSITARLNAENLRIYTKKKPTVSGTGATSYFCSKTWGCKMKVYFSTGATDNSWSIFIDASQRLANEDADVKERFENDIITAYRKAFDSPTMNNAAASVSAVSTSVADSSSSSKDAIFEIGNLY